MSYEERITKEVYPPPPDAKYEIETGRGANTGYSHGHAQAKIGALVFARRADAEIATLRAELALATAQRAQLLDELADEGNWKRGKGIIPPRKHHTTEHVGCCYCGKCGHDHDECVCNHNDMLARLPWLADEGKDGEG